MVRFYLRLKFLNSSLKLRKYVQDVFLNFVTLSAEEPDRVENNRFLENCSMDFIINHVKFVQGGDYNTGLFDIFKLFREYQKRENQNLKESNF